MVRPLLNLKREAPPERSDVLQLCSISRSSVCIRQVSPHVNLSEVRAGRQVRGVAIAKCPEWHVLGHCLAWPAVTLMRVWTPG